MCFIVSCLHEVLPISLPYTDGRTRFAVAAFDVISVRRLTDMIITKRTAGFGKPDIELVGDFLSNPRTQSIDWLSIGLPQRQSG